jgi:hypothetical protein
MCVLWDFGAIVGSVSFNGEANQKQHTWQSEVIACLDGGHGGVTVTTQAPNEPNGPHTDDRR